MTWAHFMSIVKYKVDTETGQVKFVSGFTKPYGDTQKQGRKKKQVKKVDTQAELNSEEVEYL